MSDLLVQQSTYYPQDSNRHPPFKTCSTQTVVSRAATYLEQGRFLTVQIIANEQGFEGRFSLIRHEDYCIDECQISSLQAFSAFLSEKMRGDGYNLHQSNFNNRDIDHGGGRGQILFQSSRIPVQGQLQARNLKCNK